MTLQPGYNIVTTKVAEAESTLAALLFFRSIAADEPIEAPVTVTGLEDLLFNADPADRGDIVNDLRDLLRRSSSLGAEDAVQFLIDGSFVDDVRFQIRIERSEEPIYLNVGDLFVERPRVLSSDQAVARK